MADEAAGTRAGEHDGMDAWIAVDAVHQLVEFVGDVEAEQAVRPAVDPHDQNRAAVLDVEVVVVLVCHGCCFRGDFVGVGSCYNEVIRYYNQVIPAAGKGPLQDSCPAWGRSKREMPTDMSRDSTLDGVPERLVQAAIGLLAELGPSAIKARTVASAAGLSTMAVYQPLRWDPRAHARRHRPRIQRARRGVFPAAGDG